MVGVGEDFYLASAGCRAFKPFEVTERYFWVALIVHQQERTSLHARHRFERIGKGEDGARPDLERQPGEEGGNDSFRNGRGRACKLWVSFSFAEPLELHRKLILNEGVVDLAVRCVRSHRLKSLVHPRSAQDGCGTKGKPDG